MTALEQLAGDAQVFLAKVWASRVHVHRTDPRWDVGLTQMLSLEDVDALLTGSGIRTPAVRVARSGSVLPAERFTVKGASISGQSLTGLVSPRKLLAEYDDGATIVLQGLHRYHPPLARLVADLELELGHPCQANAYLTPPGSQGFAVHSDSHDVFVFQTAGTKQWEIHEEGVVHDLLLEPGVCAYLPTGTPHAARAQEAASLHVTIGINQLTWRTLVDRALAEVMNARTSAHLPAGYLGDPDLLADGLAARLRELADRLQTVDPAAIAREQVESFLSSRNPRLAGSLLDRMTAVEAGTQMRLRPGRPFVVSETRQHLHIHLGDRVLTLPARVRRSVDWLAAQQGFAVGDVPGLDGPGKLVLCRRLLREGALEVLR